MITLCVIHGRLLGCEPRALELESVRALAWRASEAGRFTVLRESVSTRPDDIACMLVLAESHLLVRATPSTGELLFEIASCSGSAPAEAAWDLVRGTLPHQDEAARRETLTFG